MASIEDGNPATVRLIKEFAPNSLDDPNKFAEEFAENMLVEFPSDIKYQVVIVSFKVPSVADRNKPWFRLDQAGRLIGIYRYQGDGWVPFGADIVPVYGNSNVPPDGYRVIDVGDSEIEDEVVAHLKQFYFPSEAPYSFYYAKRIGD